MRNRALDHKKRAHPCAEEAADSQHFAMEGETDGKPQPLQPWRHLVWVERRPKTALAVHCLAYLVAALVIVAAQRAGNGIIKYDQAVAFYLRNHQSMQRADAVKRGKARLMVNARGNTGNATAAAAAAEPLLRDKVTHLLELMYVMEEGGGNTMFTPAVLEGIRVLEDLIMPPPPTHPGGVNASGVWTAGCTGARPGGEAGGSR